jgi:quercetin dioxygenase-like cupin family protein
MRQLKIAVPLGGANMKKTFVVTAVVGLALLGTAAWATLPQVDPATVPIGNLVANNRVRTPLKIKVDGHATHRLGHGTEVFIRHLEFPAGTSTGWHTHLGPVLVNVVRGSLTLYDGDDKTCTGVTYTAGHGFIDPGFGHVHLARNEGSEPTHFYATYILPPDAGDTLAIPASPNPNCPASVR